MNWDAETWVAAVSALLALASLLLTAVVVRHQSHLQFESLKAQMDAEVVAWAQEAIASVAFAEMLARRRGVAYAPEEFRRLASETAQKLSALGDGGRLFFPNDTPEAHGREKEAAFQGFRQPILDAVIFACSQLERVSPDGPEPDNEAAAFLNKCRRLLVSEAQNAIDPRRRRQMLQRLAIGRVDDKKSTFAAAAELGEAMETRYPGFLVERRDAKWIAAREAMSRAALKGATS
jgi:hypothetical protein